MSDIDPLSTTVGDLCLAALKECGQVGVGQTALAEDITDTWSRLQWMLQQWQFKRFLVYHLVDYAIVCTGAEFYTFGPGGQINTNSKPTYTLGGLRRANGGAGYVSGELLTLSKGPNSGSNPVIAQVRVDTINGASPGPISTFTVLGAGTFLSPLPDTFTQGSTSGAGIGAEFNLPTWQMLPARVAQAGTISQRPDKLESAFLRQIQNTGGNQVDYPLQILESMEDYNRIRLKTLVSFPGAVFMDANWPLSIVRPYPLPQGGGIYELHLTIKEQLPCRFASLATLINLPYEYYQAILHNLALRMRSRYNIPSFPGDQLPGLAKDSLATIRGSNTEIAELTIDPNLTRSGLYNIFSDTIY